MMIDVKDLRSDSTVLKQDDHSQCSFQKAQDANVIVNFWQIKDKQCLR